jgi:hypothetical protein
MSLKQDALGRELSIKDREYFSWDKSLDNRVAKRVVTEQTYAHKSVILDELKCRGVDISTLPLLVNNRGISISLNDGSLIYTE